MYYSVFLQLGILGFVICSHLQRISGAHMERATRRVDVFVGNLEVMSVRNCCTVAKPRTDYMNRKRLAEFRLASCSQILKQLRLRRLTGSLDDPLKLGS